MTLPEFLLARIAEDEDAARAAIMAGDGRWHVGGTWSLEDVKHRVVSADASGEVAFTYDDGAAHIARHDPARVLSECEAKRRIIYGVEAKATATERVAPLAGEAIRNGSWTLRVLAAVYADRPDYDEGWKP